MLVGDLDGEFDDFADQASSRLAREAVMASFVMSTPSIACISRQHPQRGGVTGHLEVGIFEQVLDPTVALSV